MGTRGYIAYLYKGRYYATFIYYDAYPDGLGDWFASKIPRDDAEREAWIEALPEQIEQEMAWRRKHDIADDEVLQADYDCVEDEPAKYEFIALHQDRLLLFQKIIEGTQWKLLPRPFREQYTYVIDLDSRAFTVNALVHFRLDNMPPRTDYSYIERIYAHCSDDGDNFKPIFAHPPSTPIEYIATVARWPPPNFDVSQVHEEYAKLSPIILSTKEWGAPTWTSLTVAQQLSADLVQTVLLDNAATLSNPDMNERYSFGVCCWQLLSAAAPYHLKLPTEGGPRHESYSLHQLGENQYPSCLTPYYNSFSSFSIHRNLDHQYHWFRGCLVVFCPRLDVAQYVEHETIQMVENLRKYGRTTAIGIAFSGRHILAVAVDDDTVRSSHPLLFHDAKLQCKTGFLLATHLLSPLLAVNKTQCLGKPSPSLTSTARTKLPKELIQHIVFQLDHDTFQGIHAVSRLFREQYILYPRIRDHFLLAYITDGNYRVLDTATGDTTTAHLQRCGRWNACNEDLSGSFQHIHPGPHNLDPVPDTHMAILRGHNSEHEVSVQFSLQPRKSQDWPKVRLQAVKGIWCFVDPAKAESNFPEASIWDSEE